MRPVPVGAKGKHTITVGEDHLASKLDPSLDARDVHSNDGGNHGDGRHQRHQAVL